MKHETKIEHKTIRTWIIFWCLSVFWRWIKKNRNALVTARRKKTCRDRVRPIAYVVMMIVMMIMMMARVIGDTKHGGGLAPVSEWPLPPRSVQTRHCCEPGPVAGAANKRLLSSLLSLSSPRHVPHQSSHQHRQPRNGQPRHPGCNHLPRLKMWNTFSEKKLWAPGQRKR